MSTEDAASERTDGRPLAIDATGVGVVAEHTVLLAPQTFTVAAGTALAVTGSNGSGKTTLLRVLAGLTRPTTGAVHVAGVAVDERKPAFRRAVAALIGYPPVARDLTLEEHLTLVGASWQIPVADARRAARELLADFGIKTLRDRFAHELSSGQSQLFTLALTLARPSDVLLLDEPEQRLDADRLDLVARRLRAIVDDGRTLVFASHDGGLVDALSDQTLALADTAPERAEPTEPPERPEPPEHVE